MAKQAKEKENLDFFYLGEKKVEPNKSKNKNVVKSKNKTKTVSPKKKSKNKMKQLYYVVFSYIILVMLHS